MSCAESKILQHNAVLICFLNCMLVQTYFHQSFNTLFLWIHTKPPPTHQKKQKQKKTKQKQLLAPQTTTVNLILFIASTTHLSPCWHLLFVTCPRFQIIRKTKREHEVSSDRKPVVHPKPQASEVCIHPHHVWKKSTKLITVPNLLGNRFL